MECGLYAFTFKNQSFRILSNYSSLRVVSFLLSYLFSGFYLFFSVHFTQSLEVTLSTKQIVHTLHWLYCQIKS